MRYDVLAATANATGFRSTASKLTYMCVLVWSLASAVLQDDNSADCQGTFQLPADMPEHVCLGCLKCFSPVLPA